MTDPIQQQLIEARKNQILDAAALVFAEKGFHLTTIRDIAKRAGISDGTIYNYFESKPALLLGIFERMRATSVEAMPPIPEDIDFRTLVSAFVAHPLQALQEDNFALFRIVVSEMMVNEELRTLYYEQILAPTLAIAEPHFQRQMAQRGVSAEESQVILRAISGMILGLMMQHIMGDVTVQTAWDKLPDVLMRLLFDGLESE